LIQAIIYCELTHHVVQSLKVIQATIYFSGPYLLKSQTFHTTSLLILLSFEESDFPHHQPLDFDNQSSTLLEMKILGMCQQDASLTTVLCG
jgi:hypothetical protein